MKRLLKPKVESISLLGHPEAMDVLEERIKALRKGASILSMTSDDTRKKALESMAEAIVGRRSEIEKANKEDIAAAENDGIS